MRPRTPNANTQVKDHDRFDIDHIPANFLFRAMASRFPGKLPNNLLHNRLFLLLSSLVGEEDLTQIQNFII